MLKLLILIAIIIVGAAINSRLDIIHNDLVYLQSHVKLGN